jgi:hypothetical protein
MSVFNQMADSIPALAAVGSSVTSCAIFMSCAGLASNISSAAQAVSTADPAKIFDSARHFVLDPFADIANHASSGDWNGAGVASGHVAVAVVQVALAVSGICEAVLADSCFLPTIADVMDLGDAATAVAGAKGGTGEADVLGVSLSRSVQPDMYDQITRVEAERGSSVYTHDPALAGPNRATSLEGYPPSAGYDRSEWPPASTQEGGSGADVQYLSPSQNRSNGASIGNQLRGLPAGTRWQIRWRD